MSKELAAVLMAVLVVLGFAVVQVPEADDDPSQPPSIEMGPSIDPGG